VTARKSARQHEGVRYRRAKRAVAAVSGDRLWAMMHGSDIVLKYSNGGMSMITQANVFQSNGIIHVIDTVVLPQ
jgi:uncharacterized surface protein with fasciclin (FAS1) repeats